MAEYLLGMPVEAVTSEIARWVDMFGSGTHLLEMLRRKTGGEPPIARARELLRETRERVHTRYSVPMKGGIAPHILCVNPFFGQTKTAASDLRERILSTFTRSDLRVFNKLQATIAFTQSAQHEWNNIEVHFDATDREWQQGAWRQ